MDKPGKLKDKFDDLGSESQDEQLLWENSGPLILREVEQRKRRRRLVWWWFSAIGVLLVAALAYTYLDSPPTTSSPFLDDLTDHSIGAFHNVVFEKM